MEMRSHARRLVGVLAARHPGVLHDAGFLERAVLVDGLILPNPSPSDLRLLFSSLGAIDAAVLVNGANTGEHVGLVLFSDSRSCSAATRWPPHPGFYGSIIQAASVRVNLEEALMDVQLRRPIAAKLASMIPTTYCLGDAEEDLHLRSVFLAGVELRMPDGCRGGEHLDSRDGALFVYEVVRPYLQSATADLSAVVLSDCGRFAVLISDEVVNTEKVATMARSLCPTGIRVYDSSLFPLRPAGGVGQGGGPMMELLPAFCQHPDYRGRVVVLRGFDTRGQHRNAGSVCEYIQRYLTRLHRLQALVVHRAASLVVAVVGSRADALRLLEEPEESWVEAFGGPITCLLMDAAQFPSKLRASAPEFAPTPGVHQEAMKSVHGTVYAFLCRRDPGDLHGIARGLIARLALSDPHAVRDTRSGEFAARAVLLLGLADATTESHLRAALLPVGGFFAYRLFRPLGVGFVVFRNASGATKVLSEPMQRWIGSGFRECRPAPAAEFAGEIADRVLARRLLGVQWIYSSRIWSVDDSERQACIRILELLDTDTGDFI